MNQKITDEEILVIAHRKASTYTHRSEPTSHAYGFVKHTMIDFARAIEEAITKKSEAPDLSMSMFASRFDYYEAMRAQVVLITDEERRKNMALLERLDEMPIAQPVQPTPLTSEEMADVTEYLEAWGCLYHPSVARLVLLGKAAIAQPTNTDGGCQTGNCMFFCGSKACL